jgi:hypothetical protein
MLPSGLVKLPAATAHEVFIVACVVAQTTPSLVESCLVKFYGVRRGAVGATSRKVVGSIPDGLIGIFH